MNKYKKIILAIIWAFFIWLFVVSCVEFNSIKNRTSVDAISAGGIFSSNVIREARIKDNFLSLVKHEADIPWSGANYGYQNPSECERTVHFYQQRGFFDIKIARNGDSCWVLYSNIVLSLEQYNILYAFFAILLLTWIIIKRNYVWTISFIIGLYVIYLIIGLAFDIIPFNIGM